MCVAAQDGQQSRSRRLGSAGAADADCVPREQRDGTVPADGADHRIDVQITIVRRTTGGQRHITTAHVLNRRVDRHRAECIDGNVVIDTAPGDAQSSGPGNGADHQTAGTDQ